MTKKEPIVKNTERVKEAISDLNQLFQSDVPRCSEEYFREAILPMLLSTEERPSLQPWLQVSDNVKRPLDVYRGSELLFRCPPISRRFTFKPARHRGDTMFEHVAKSLQKDDVVPTLGQRYIGNAVKAKTQVVALSEAEKEEWRVVLRHFGVIKDPNATKVAEPQTTASPSSDGDFIDDYELA